MIKIFQSNCTQDCNQGRSCTCTNMQPATLEGLVTLARSKYNTMPTLAKSLKLMEEVGEMSEAILITNGTLKHKKLAEPVINETADVVICLMDILSDNYPDHPPEELVNALMVAVATKSLKWDKVMKLNSK